MRNHVINQITEYAETREDILLICADLGYNVVNEFAEKRPAQFINVGISEQNMASVAAGLALEGNMVFTYSIGNFATLRCIEQIRNDICYHNANVKILAVGGGFAYGELGMSHHATEDIAMMRALPNMRVYVPADEVEALACLEDAMLYDGPAYIRMAKGREPNYHANGIETRITSLVPYKDYFETETTEVALLTVGTVLAEAIIVAEELEKSGIACAVYSVPVVKPIDQDRIRELGQKCGLIVTLEDHNIIGGLGGAVAEILASYHENARLLRIGLPDSFTLAVGDQDYIRDYYGISAPKVVSKILGILEK